MACLSLICLLSGCATTPATFVIDPQARSHPDALPTMWPGPPEVPRYAYAGELLGEDNFVREKGAEKGAGEFFSWLVGLIGGPAKPVTLQRPQSGMVDETGRVYVTDVSRGGVYVFDPALGELQVWERAYGLDSFIAPIGIAPAPDGGIFVADADHAYVAHLDRKGEPVGRIGKNLLIRPTGLAWHAKRGHLYVADTHGHDIKVFDAVGNQVDVLGERGEGDGEFNFPTHLTITGDELYVTDTMNSRIQVFDLTTGKLIHRFGERGLLLGNMVRPKGVGVDSEGNIYVVESYHDHLLVFDRHGQFLLPIGGTGKETGNFFLPAGVWVDGRDRVYVADMMNGRISVFQFLGGDQVNGNGNGKAGGKGNGEGKGNGNGNGK